MAMKFDDIVRYWEIRQDECGLAVDWSEAHERCWRCGHQTKLERCHIIPRSLGGPDHPSNIVLLCSHCHREAPNVADPEFMWFWIRRTCVPFYDTYWYVRGYREFERLFERKPFAELDENQLRGLDIEELVFSELENSTIHFGEVRRNAATLAWVFYRVEKRILEGASDSTSSRSDRLDPSNQGPYGTPRIRRML